MSRPDYLPSYLTEQQVEAIVHQGSPLLIIAGPGSGKTEVLTWRVAHLVRAGLVAPEHLLVTTFTNKAALELKDRIQIKLPEVHVEAMQVGTLHSFCADLLRRYQIHSSLPRGFHILDEHGQFLFVYVHRKALGLNTLVKGRPYDFFANVLRLFNLATEELVEPDRLGEWCACRQTEAEACAAELAGGRSKTKAKKAASEVARWCEQQVVVEAYQQYVDLLHERSLADFALLQRHAYDLLNAHSQIVAELRDRYQAILVDEYQDTNAVQERLLHLLAGNGAYLTVVGDDDQSIYRFRGATVRNLLAFPDCYPGTRVIRLTQNFRSREPIVAHSLNVIVHNPARFEKALFTQRGPGSDVLLVYEHKVDEEAAALTDLLRRLHDVGKIRRWSDVVLLLRSVRSYAAAYADALRTAGIPVVVTGDATLFERDDVRQLVNLFTFLGATKPWGDVHVRQPILELAPETVAALHAFPGYLLDLDDAQLQEIGVASPTDRRKLLALLALKRRVQAKGHASLLEVLYALLTISGYARRCEQTGDPSTGSGQALDALLNLGVFSRLVAAFDEHAGTRTLYPFLDYLKLMRAGGVDPAVVEPEDVVRVMTIHQAKGLEFPVVVVGSVMNGRLPTTRRRAHYEVPHELRASGEPEVADPHLVDERKLFYVAATRARELLILGTADVVNKRGGGPSPFLVEMLGEDLHAAADLSRAIVAEVESQVGHDAGPRERLSFSQLAFFLQCPVRYKFAVVYGLVVPHPDPVDFGANVHRALLSIHERARAGQVPTPTEVEEIVTAAWLPAPQAHPTQDRRAQQAAIQQLRHYVARHGQSLSEVAEAEASFSFGLERHVLVGKIDLLRRADDGYELVDFKTGRSAPAALEPVDVQLDLYALGAETSLGLPIVRQSAHFVGDDTIHTREWSPERAEATRGWLKDLVDRIVRREFPPRPAYCPRCTEFRGLCPYGEEQP